MFLIRMMFFKLIFRLLPSNPFILIGLMALTFYVITQTDFLIWFRDAVGVILVDAFSTDH